VRSKLGSLIVRRFGNLEKRGGGNGGDVKSNHICIFREKKVGGQKVGQAGREDF